MNVHVSCTVWFSTTFCVLYMDWLKSLEFHYLDNFNTKCTGKICIFETT